MASRCLAIAGTHVSVHLSTILSALFQEHFGKNLRSKEALQSELSPFALCSRAQVSAPYHYLSFPCFSLTM